MKYNKPNLYFLLSLFIFASCSYNQINENLPNLKFMNWSKAGARIIQKENLPSYNDSIIIPSPTNSPDANFRNITKGITEASKKNGITAVILGGGRYTINRPIVFRIGLDRIILKGSNNSEIHYLGHAQKPSSIIKVYGKSPNWERSAELMSYYDETKKIILNKKLNKISIGDFIEIRLQNGKWHDSDHHKSWNPQNYLGTIVKVIDFNEKKFEYTIDQSILTEWELLKSENVIAKAIKFIPIQDIGIKNLKLSTDNINNRQGVNVDFYYAANCWVDNIESAYAASVHINISNSTSIEVRNSTMHHAKDYGNPAVPEEKLVAGTGYGVNVARSSGCLIENNTFYHLRHAMLIALGSNRNVFGYNRSYDQYSYPVKNLSDLNLHGHYPYNNLFEGNIVERIHADQWWGSNGPNNTFIGNIVKKGKIKLEKTNNAYLINNKAELDLIDSNVKLDTLKIDALEKNSNSDQEKLSKIRKNSFYLNSTTRIE